MQFLYILTLNDSYRITETWTEEIQKIQGAHFLYLKDLFEKGIMKHVGRTDVSMDSKDLHGYAIFEAENEEEANLIMKNDPAVLNGIMSAQLIPYKIVFQ